MNSKKVQFILIIFIIFINSVVAMPALNKVKQIIQPDGSIVSIVYKGDEWQNWIETAEGYSIKQSSVDRYWYYIKQHGSNVVLSDIAANNKNIPLNLDKGIRPTAVAKSRPLRAAAKGTTALKSVASESYGQYTGKILFILAEFTNRAGQTSEASWASLLSNKVADYYNKASYGKVALQTATESFGTANNGIIGWVNLGYQHPNPSSNDTLTAQKMTYDAIVAANPYINFSNYDTNNDGYVDTNELAIVIVVAGYEQAYGGSTSPGVWAHQYSLQTAPIVDGVKVGEYHRNAGGYARFGEFHNDHQATMGLIVHELGHLVFGLPDLYDIDQSSDGIGSFGLMGGGSWGKQSSDTWAGETPVLPTAWVQVNRGWVTATEGSSTASITAAGDSSANSSNSVIKASSSNTSEYFLLQNRQNIGYDRGLEEALGLNFSGGLNIFHIDETQVDNSNDQRRWVDVETANGVTLRSSAESNRNLWYSGNASTFNDSSSPNSRLYNGSQSGINIHSISNSGIVMSASFGEITSTNDDSVIDPQITVATLLSPASEITDTTPTYVWSAVSDATWYYLYVKDSTGDKVTQWYTAAEAGCADASQNCSLTSIAELALGTVEWQVRTWNDAGDVGWSTVRSFSLSSENNIPAATTLVTPIGDISDDTPTYTWNAVTGSTWYYLYVDDSTENGKIAQWYTAQDALCADALGTCSITPTTKLALGDAKWWIKTWNKEGEGPWSNASTFAVNSTSNIPIATTLISPSGTITDSTPTYTWNAVAGATWYYLWSDDSSGNRISTWYKAEEVGCATTGTTNCSITPNTRLAIGAGRWWVKTWSEAGSGPWSEASNFTVTQQITTVSSTPSAARLISPEGRIRDNTPRYTWRAVADATWYYLWVDDRRGNRISTWYTAQEVGCSTGIGRCSITPSVVLNRGEAEWWVRTWNSSGNGPWSTVKNFRIR